MSGGNRGFGQAIAIRFAEEGAKVVPFSRSGCDETVRLIGQIDGLEDADAVALSGKCDISDEAQAAALVKQVTEKFGQKIDGTWCANKLHDRGDIGVDQ